ncbi:uncharacterized protein LOC142305511 [Anomaloglossus baeobatrachus]|uniref:uncharacterized protein LOC142305511 n=1 Tax=Anomaloglossus baeobatrachus TaxID=238106 RepID=UPI003F4F829C
MPRLHVTWEPADSEVAEKRRPASRVRRRARARPPPVQHSPDRQKEEVTVRDLEEKQSLRKAMYQVRGPLYRGVVEEFSLKTGYSVIEVPFIKEGIFASRRDVRSHLPRGYPVRDLHMGDLVEFTRHQGQRGWFALDVVPCPRSSSYSPAVSTKDKEKEQNKNKEKEQDEDTDTAKDEDTTSTTEEDTETSRCQSPTGKSPGCERRKSKFDDKFIAFCRLPQQGFDELLTLLRPKITHADTYMRQAISAEQRLLVTLRFLATGENFSSLNLQFRLGKTTISEIIKETCQAIWESLQPIVMPNPTEESLKKIADDFFQIANFPHCIGTIDGKHIRIQQPPRSGSNFFNYKKYFSIVLMAVADAKYNFITIDVGAHGSTGDSRVLQNSQIGLQFIYNSEFIPAPEPIPGSDIPFPYVFVADEAFPLLQNLLLPFPRRGLDVPRRIFNYRLSRARRYVECTFGIMSSQWRILHTPIQLNVSTVDFVIKTCCVLHNFLRKYRFEINEDEIPLNFHPCPSISGRLNNLGISVRDQFTDYFMSDVGALPWQYRSVGVEPPNHN